MKLVRDIPDSELKFRVHCPLCAWSSLTPSPYTDLRFHLSLSHQFGRLSDNGMYSQWGFIGMGALDDEGELADAIRHEQVVQAASRL